MQFIVSNIYGNLWYFFLQKATKGLVTLDIKVISLYILNTNQAEGRNETFYSSRNALQNLKPA